MKSLVYNSPRTTVLLLLSLLLLAGVRPAAAASHAAASHAAASHAGASHAAASPAASKGTNAPAASAPIPLAVFDVVSSPVKDPFYPRTTRSPVPVVAAGTNVIAAPAARGFSAVSFRLNALSGPSYARLASINNKVLAVGEDAEITTSSGKVRIHVVDIKDFSVVIQAGNQAETIELRLRPGLQ